MTESEEKKLINDIHSQCCDEANILCTTDADNRCIALEMAIKALEEVQQYREVGTVEECREAVGKQEAKMVCGIHEPESPEDIEAYGKGTLFGDCPVCGELQNTLWNIQYCGDCGQKLDWSSEK